MLIQFEFFPSRIVLSGKTSAGENNIHKNVLNL